MKAACETTELNKPYPDAYPPRFVLEVSSRYARHHSVIELTFTGARRELSTEIQLHPLRSELIVPISHINKFVKCRASSSDEQDLTQYNHNNGDQHGPLDGPLPFQMAYGHQSPNT